jgi:hypothetical protein
MTRKALAALALACVALSGCASMPGGSGIPSQILDNLENCKRSYRGGTGIGAVFTFDIECEPHVSPPAAAP